MQKINRLVAIENIIAKGKISSQSELVGRLKKLGIECTQATMSRSLRRLGVVKVPDESGGYRYTIPSSGAVRRAPSRGFGISGVIRSVVEANSMIIIKTSPGYASSVAVTIDNAGRFEIAGTIAGDDTLLVIPRNEIPAAHIYKILGIIFPGMEKIPLT